MILSKLKLASVVHSDHRPVIAAGTAGVLAQSGTGSGANRNQGPPRATRTGRNELE